MIYFVLAYAIFLMVYLPINFYMVFRISEMRLSKDHTSMAIAFFVAGIAAMLLLSLLVVAVGDWPEVLLLER